MLKVRNSVRHRNKMKNGRLGVFASQAIRHGQSVWEWVQGFDSRFAVMPHHPVAKQFVAEYGFKPLYDPQNYYLCGDNMRFINHSHNPNLVPRVMPAEPPEKGMKQHLVAARRIEKNEELTIDYTKNSRLT